GMVRISMNLGVPLSQVADVLAAATGGDETLWQEWRRTPETTEGLLPHLLTRLIDASGPGVALSITGADLNEMIPVPVVLWCADGDPALVDELGAMLHAVVGDVPHPVLFDS